MSKQINFISNEDSVEKLRQISFYTRKEKRELLQEGLDYIIKKYGEYLNE